MRPFSLYRRARRLVPVVLAGWIGLAAAAAIANPTNLRVEENETTLPSNASACGGLASNAGWSLVRRNNVPTALEGQVVQGHVASSDFAGVGNSMHGTIDHNFFVYPDERFRGLVAKPGNFQTGADVERGRIEVEWEIGLGPLPFAGGFNSHAWPTVGDRVYVLGSHILDCGHSPYRSEIHAPRLVVTYRNAAQSDFAGASNRKGSVFAFRGNNFEPTPASCTDVFISSYGGESVESEYDNEDVNLSELYGWDTGPQGAPQTWWQPVNDRDYTFDVMAPPRPSPGATLVLATFAYIMQGTTGPAMRADVLPSGDGWRITIPFRGWQDPPSHVMRVSGRLYAGWEGTRQQVPRLQGNQVRTYKVTVKKMHCYDDLEWNGRGNWKLWGYVNEVGQQLLAGGGTTSLRETWRHVNTGEDVATFTNPTFQVTLVEGQPLRVSFRAVEVDNTTDDDAGTAEKIWTGDDRDWADREHTVRSGNTSAMGGEDEDKACRRAGGCYDLTYRIDRIKDVVPDARMITEPKVQARETVDPIVVLNNPLHTGLLRLRVAHAAADLLEGRVHDVRGRVVCSLGEGAEEGTSRTFTWDGRDAGGRDVPNGVYFAVVRFAGTGVEMSRKITVLR